MMKFFQDLQNLVYGAPGRLELLPLLSMMKRAGVRSRPFAAANREGNSCSFSLLGCSGKAVWVGLLLLSLFAAALPVDAQTNLRRTVLVLRVDQGEVENLQGGIVAQDDVKLFTRDLSVLCFYLFAFNLETDAWEAFPVPADAAISFGIKQGNDREGVFLAYSGNAAVNAAGDWALADRATGKISIRVDANTVQMLELFETSDAQKDLVGEIQMLESGATLPTTLAQFDVRVIHDIVQGDESVPSDAIPPYVTLDMVQEQWLVETTGGPFFEHYSVTEWDTLYRGTQGSVSTNTVTDAIIETYTVNPSVTDYQAIPTYERNPDESAYAFASSDEALATVDSTGLVSYVADGDVEITVSLGTFSKVHTLSLTSGNSYNVTNIVAGAATYLRKKLTDGVDTALVADAGANDDELFDTKDWVGHSYVRNASSWAYAATASTDPWSGLAVWATGKTGAGPSIRGTLISPDLVACAWHNRPALGSEYKWLGTDNVVYTRTVSSVRRVGTGDGCLVKLDSALPPPVVPLKILPGNWQASFFYLPDHLQLPVISVNKQLQTMVADLTGIQANENNLSAGALESVLPNREPYYQLPIGGDSGSPVMLVLDDELILVLTWLTPSYGSAFVDGTLLDEAVDALGATPPTVIDFSSYPQNTPGSP